MKLKPRYVRRFSASERVAHWVHFAAFAVLVVTGLFIYSPALRPFTIGAAGTASRFLHRISGIVFILCPLIYLIGDPKGFFGSLKEAVVWKPRDFEWLRKAWHYYTRQEGVEVPPQGKYNAGQKLNVLTQIIAFILFTVTGLLMWFGRGSISSSLFMWSVVVHDLSAIAVVVLFLVHIYLVAIHPFTRESITSMFEGVVTREYAEEHHGEWYKKVHPPAEV